MLMVFIPSMYGKLGDGLSWAISFTNIIFMLVQSKPLLRVWLRLQTLARKMVHISEILHIEHKKVEMFTVQWNYISPFQNTYKGF